MSIACCFDDSKVSAHTAIIPTNEAVNVGAMTQAEQNVYKAICGHYLIQFMPGCKKRNRPFFLMSPIRTAIRPPFSRAANCFIIAKFIAETNSSHVAMQDKSCCVGSYPYRCFTSSALYMTPEYLIMSQYGGCQKINSGRSGMSLFIRSNPLCRSYR